MHILEAKYMWHKHCPGNSKCLTLVIGYSVCSNECSLCYSFEGPSINLCRLIIEKNTMWQYHNGFKGNFNYYTAKRSKAQLHNSLLVKLQDRAPKLTVFQDSNSRRACLFIFAIYTPLPDTFFCKMVTKILMWTLEERNRKTIYHFLCCSVN